MKDYLPPGFRFYPTEEELVSFYLHNKLEGRNERLNRLMDRVIPVLDLYEFNPWDLPRFSGDLCYGDPEQWFFFVPRQESESRGGRPKRLTTCGYWKATGCPGHVYSSDDRKIGCKRTMVFYNGRAPNGRKTEWKMNEYKLLALEFEGGGASSSSGALPTPALREELSLCRVYKKSKCVRAYDRRPIGVEISGPNNQQKRGDETRLTTHESLDPTVERTVTPDTENSSTGDHQDQYPPETGESSSIAMAANTDPLWEWEQLYMDFDFDKAGLKPN